MKNVKMLNYIRDVLTNMPADWLNLTTHRLDIYEEELAKTQFLDHFTTLFNNNNSEYKALKELPTAYDYIRLGHPLSSILEWVIAYSNALNAENVITFSSKTIPIFAILRKNLLTHINTQILYTGELPSFFNTKILRNIYGYKFELKKIEKAEAISAFNGSTIFITEQENLLNFNLIPSIDFLINIHSQLGSILVVNGEKNKSYISEIQHVRRRETIAMTPINTLHALKFITEKALIPKESNVGINKTLVLESIASITNTNTTALVSSSGLSIQYAILMGLINHALEQHKGKAIKIIVPPNCYGGTNDQARRIAACISNVTIIDLPVDSGNNMAHSIGAVLDTIANHDAIPYIIAEIPTNPRVEVPDLMQLKTVLSKERKTKTGVTAIPPVFILDQTFCPNVDFLGVNHMLSAVKVITYISGSKFPSGGLCTAGYCVANEKAESLMQNIAVHLELCDNEATPLQYEILAKQLPNMKQRINDAYKNTREFVDFITANLPEAKINFVSEILARKGFTPSVFSIDLPTKGDTEEEKESYKRALNLKLIHLMITEIPDESKFCVSYGQLKGSYWTIPATSTQGTTKENDKDYIVRASLSPNLNLELHKKVFLSFVESI